MFRGILIRLRPVTLLVVVLAIALGSVPMAVAAQANRPSSAIRSADADKGRTGNGYSRGHIQPILQRPNHHAR